MSGRRIGCRRNDVQLQDTTVQVLRFQEARDAEDTKTIYVDAALCV